MREATATDTGAIGASSPSTVSVCGAPGGPVRLFSCSSPQFVRARGVRLWGVLLDECFSSLLR